MIRPKTLLYGLLVLVCAIVGAALLLSDLEASRPVPPLYVDSIDLDGRSPPPPVEFSEFAPMFWARRVGTEVLLLSEPGAAVEFLDESGRVLGKGRSDPAGAFRGALPEAAGSVALRFAAGTTAAWRLPGIPGALPRILVDPPVLRPGDAVRICVRTEGDADPAPGFESGDAGVPFPAPEAIPWPETSPRWRVFVSRIPDDARPGIALVSAGDARLEFPVEGRFGPTDGAGGGSPDAPAAAPDPGPGGLAPSDGLHLRWRDGRWSAAGPADAGSVLFYAESGGRLLAHQAVAAIDGAAATALPLGDDPPAKVRVVAIASTPRGYLETFSGDSGPPLRGPEDDPVLARFLAERSARRAAPAGPAWIHEGDEPAGPGPAPPSRQGFLARTGGASAEPGVETAVRIPGGARVRWSVPPGGAAGSLRIRDGGGILAEARIGPGKEGGSFLAADPAPRSLLVESDAPGLGPVSFVWTLDGRAGSAPTLPGAFLAIDRTLPEGGRSGDVVEYSLVIRWRERAAGTEISCPIPRGAVLAEDGWSIRARAPAGTRVETPDGAVILRIPAQEPGEAILSFRIRLAWPGRYAAPAAVARNGDDEALGAAGFLVIE